ncbi:unnamed protein product [Lactuca virosa]|uniref:HMA domain-containing protein n=1 Tax=Lactuca virosa TaxID=75947 RepID=A0AAU9M318_9ASTR|nr:unnamed protein product [Lactuca virosa]
MGGKNKQRGNVNGNGNIEEHNLEETNNDGTDENSNESKAKNNNNNNKQGNVVIVLGVHLHCQGCVETVVKSLRGFDGVEEIEPNTKDHRVIVKGKNADPIKVAERLRKKSGKHVDLISPIPKKQQEKKQQEKKPEAPKVVEKVLKMYLHCEGCAKEVKHCLHKMQGVQTVNIDMKASHSHVIVKGSFDPNDLVAYISKRAGRHAEIVNVKNNQNKNKNEGGVGGDQQQKGENDHNWNGKKEKGNDHNNNNKKNTNGFAYPQVPPELVYAQDLFSDENPNACSIM